MAGKIYCTWLKMKSCVTMSGKFYEKQNDKVGNVMDYWHQCGPWCWIVFLGKSHLLPVVLDSPEAFAQFSHD